MAFLTERRRTGCACRGLGRSPTHTTRRCAGRQPTDKGLARSGERAFFNRSPVKIFTAELKRDWSACSPRPGAQLTEQILNAVWETRCAATTCPRVLSATGFFTRWRLQCQVALRLALSA